MVSRLFLLFIFLIANACSPQFVGKDKVKLLSLKNNLPSEFSVSSITATHASASLSWPSVENATSYSIEYGTSTGSYSLSAATALTSYTITSLTASTTYYFKVSAINQYGKSSASEVNVITTSITLPSVPLSFVATNNGTTPTLTWAAPATGSPTITYEVFRSTASGGPYISVGQPTPTTTTSFDDVVVAGTNYYYVVYGANSGGSGPASSELAFTPIALFNATMTADISNGAQTLNISWPAVTGATGYDIIYGTSTGTYSTTLANVTSPCALTSLTVNTAYYIKVRAKNATTTQLSTNELKSIDAAATGSGLAFTINFPFDAGTESYYTLSDSNEIEFVSGVARLKPIIHTISNNASFSSGSSTGVTYDTTNNYLRLNSIINYANHDPSWTPKWSNLVAYYPLDNNFNDYSGNAHNGVVAYGAMTFQNSNLKMGTHTARFAFDDYINTGTHVPYNGNLMTISIWIRLDLSPHAEDYFGIVNKENDWGDDKFYLGYNKWERRFYFFESGGDEIATEQVPNNMLHNTWAHLALVQDNSSVSIYLNGMRIGFRASPLTWGPGSSTAANFIGGYFRGDMDELAIWNTNLSVNEIEAIYNTQSSYKLGQYRSPIFDAGSSINWTDFIITSTLPFSKLLAPGLTESNLGYTSMTASSLGSGLVQYFSFDHGSGFIDNDEIISSDIGANGAGNVSVLNTLSYGPGVTGNGLHVSKLTSSTSAMKINNGDFPNFNSSDSYTYSIWVREEYRKQEDLFYIIFQMGWGNTSDQCMLTVTNSTFSGASNIGKFAVFNDGVPELMSTTTLQVGKWYHLVLTQTGGVGRKLYVNGVLEATDSNPVVCENAGQPFYIGSNSNNQEFNGKIDEFATWNRELTTTEVNELYRRGSNQISYQIRTCANSDCSDQNALASSGQGWMGPTGNHNSFFSEIHNNSSIDSNGQPTGTVGSGSLNAIFSNFSAAGLNVAANRYVQIKAVMRSEDRDDRCNYGTGATSCSPELKSITIGPNQYSTSEQTVITKVSISTVYNIFDVSGFSESLTGTSCSSGLRYNISRDGTNFYYWNGSAWTLSVGTYATASSASTISSNIATFHIAIGAGTLYIKTYLKSDGVSACGINNIQVTGKR